MKERSPRGSLSTSNPKFVFNFSLLYYKVWLRILPSSMLLLCAEALFLSLLCYCSWLLNGSVFFFLWKLKHLQADSGVTRYSQKMFVVPQELVCHLVFQKFPRNSSVVYHKIKDPFWAKICMDTSFQLLLMKWKQNLRKIKSFLVWILVTSCENTQLFWNWWWGFTVFLFSPWALIAILMEVTIKPVSCRVILVLNTI